MSKMTAKLVGILFTTAILTSLLGGGIIESILDAPNYLANLPSNSTQIIFGFYLELITGIAVVGIVVMMFPILKHHNTHLALAFIVFRTIESIFCIICAIIPFLLLALSKEATKSGNLNSDYIQSISSLLVIARSSMTNMLIPIFFSLGAFSFYYIIYQSKLIPRYISVWGGIAVIMMLLVNLLKVNSSMTLLLAFPIILNELYLGTWLFIKGFNKSL